MVINITEIFLLLFIFSLAIHNKAKIISTNFRGSLAIAPPLLLHCCSLNAIFNFRDSLTQDKLESMLLLSSLISGCHAEGCRTANWLLSMGKRQWWGRCWGLIIGLPSAGPDFPCSWLARHLGWASPPTFRNKAGITLSCREFSEVPWA